MLPSKHREDAEEENSHVNSESILVNFHDQHSFRFKAIFCFSCLLVAVLLFFQIFPQEVVDNDHHHVKSDNHVGHRL